MKAYSLLLGVVFTALYWYAAQAAIAAELARVEAKMAAVAPRAPAEPIYYGGTLATVIVYGRRLGPAALTWQPQCRVPAVRG